MKVLLRTMTLLGVLFGTIPLAVEAQIGGITPPTSSSAGGNPPVFTETGYILSDGQISLGGSYLSYIWPDEEDISFVGDRVSRSTSTTLLSGAYGIQDLLELRLDLPFLESSAEYTDPSGATFEMWDESGLGDLGLSGKIQVSKEEESRPAVALLAGITLPTGDEDKGLGAGSSRITLKGAISKHFSKASVHGDIGFVLMDEENLENIFSYDLAGVLLLGKGDRFSLSGELNGVMFKGVQVGSWEEDVGILNLSLGLRTEVSQGLLLTGALSIKTADNVSQSDPIIVTDGALLFGVSYNR